jgi:hypothetical protein
MKLHNSLLLCSAISFLAGCADYQVSRPVSTVGPSYTTVPALIDSGPGAPPPSISVSTAGPVTTTVTDVGRASSGARADLLTAVDRILENWKPQPRELAQALITKYGAPHEVTQSRLTWYNNGPWKRTDVFNAEILHNFPAPHNDMLQQVIDYRVPPDKVQDVLAYDGSILIDRTRGEMAARCFNEEMNTLTLNLAHDVVTGQRTPELAREAFAGAASQFAQGVSSALTDKLQFITAVGPTADPDQAFRAAIQPR